MSIFFLQNSKKNIFLEIKLGKLKTRYTYIYYYKFGKT